MRARALGIGALVGLVLVVGLVWWTRADSHGTAATGPGRELATEEPSSTEASGHEANPVTVATESDAASHAAQEGTPGHAPDTGVTTREPEPQFVRGIVVDADDAPVPGAVVTWSPVIDAQGRPLSCWPEVDRELRSETTAIARTGADGGFEFASPPGWSSTRASAIWISHEGHLAIALRVEPSEFHAVELGTIRMAASGSMTARVLDPWGKPVAGALVTQLCMDGVGDSGSAAPPEDGLRAGYWREFETDERGEVAIHPVPGEQVLLASVSTEGRSLEAVPWTGVHQSLVELTLGRLAFAVGTVSGNRDSGNRAARQGSVAVHCFAKRGESLHPLAQQEIRHTGEWGPAELPIDGADSFSFVLEGPGLVPQFVDELPPEQGETITVDFVATAGNELWFQVTDKETGDKLPDARVEVSWTREDEKRASTIGRPRDDGLIHLQKCPTGTVYPLVRCPGYHPAHLAPLELPEPEPALWGVELDPAGLLAGRCTADGQPVGRFNIVFWPVENSEAANLVEFRQRFDGSFEIDEAPLGEVHLLAYSDTHPPSRIHSAQVERGARAEVEIQLSEPVLGRGRVVDSTTREPVPDATIQLLVETEEFVVGTWGAAHPVDGDGSFEIRGFPPGESRFAVRAPGYPELVQRAQLGSRSEFDFGDILLSHGQPLEISLHSRDRPDYSRYSISVAGHGEPRSTSFSIDGVARFESLVPGGYRLELRFPDGSEELVDLELKAGSDWSYSYEVSETSMLVVEVVSESGQELPADAYIDVEIDGLNLLPAVRHAALPPDGRFEFVGLPAGSSFVRVFTPFDGNLGVAATTIEPGVENLVRIALDAAPSKFEIVDPEGEPVRGANFWINVPGNDFAWFSIQSDEAGRCQVRGLPPGELYGYIRHESLGVMTRFPFTAPEDSGVKTITFRAEGAVEAILVDSGNPVPGILCKLIDHLMGAAIGASVPTDAAGRVRWPRLGEGAYRVAASHPDYWPVEVLTTASTTGESTEIEIRRRGALEVIVRTASGVPVQGVELELVFENGQSAADWAEQGKLEFPAAGLITDEKGSVRVEGIPHGVYTWSAAPASGLPVSGKTVVEPAVVNELVVILQ